MASRRHRAGDALLTAKPFQDDADLVLGAMVFARGAANITDQLFGRPPPRGWGGGFLTHLDSPRGYDEPEFLRYSNCQFRLMGADGGHRIVLEAFGFD
jgi:hypothetical protein